MFSPTYHWFLKMVLRCWLPSIERAGAVITGTYNGFEDEMFVAIGLRTMQKRKRVQYQNPFLSGYLQWF
jgi:hypothetical protein